MIKGEMNIIEKGGLMNGDGRELSLLRFEKSPDGRETRLLEKRVRRMMKRGMNEMKRV